MQDQRSNPSHTRTLHTYNPPTNVPTKYQLPTLYGFRDIARTNFDHDVAHLHPLTNVPTNFLHVTVSEIQPGQDFQTHDHNGKGQIRVVHTYTP